MTQTQFLSWKLPGLPGRDDTIIGATYKHHPVQLTEAASVLPAVRGPDLVVNVRQKLAVVVVELPLVGIVPVVADRGVLAQGRVEKLVRGLANQVREEQVQEFGWWG